MTQIFRGKWKPIQYGPEAPPETRIDLLLHGEEAR